MFQMIILVKISMQKPECLPRTLAKLGLYFESDLFHYISVDLLTSCTLQFVFQFHSAQHDGE